ncbi:hypothetical protein H4219_000735 [Mycoemilia scoparia]|uniref:Lysine--tRNA ligase n=1 Tax=Mycoemilia scoparia TaxID=417184 RepID=A0A9W8DST5_9FUNG|nr:hypothetical protein H4219_000735 [Mycoemilia scoparia]
MMMPILTPTVSISTTAALNDTSDVSDSPPANKTGGKDDSSSMPSKHIRQSYFKSHNIDLYPRYVHPDPSIAPLSEIGDLVDTWDTRLQNGEKNDGSATVLTTIHGRVTHKREASKKLIFYGVTQNGRSIQVVSSKARYTGPIDEFIVLNKGIRAGDIISATGFIGKTNTGELSVFVSSDLKILSPCYHDIPFKSGLREPERRFRHRHLDLIVNKKSVSNILVRSKVLKGIRQFLDTRGFVEVETPILSTEVGGANAKPFITRSNAFGADLDMYLRIAPELFLKKLVIGGIEKVYEIGKQFRNEGVDTDHNPEFTTCEFYQAYTNLDGLISMTENLLHELTTTIRGTDEVQVIQKNGDRVKVSFKPPFNRVYVIPALEEHMGTKLPDLDEPDSVDQLLSLCRELSIPFPSEPHNIPRIMDHLISTFIEPRCIQPTFILNHPTVMSPLAKAINKEKTISGRFELFVNGKEIVNAYEELNDPDDQRERFQRQNIDRLGGDQEVPQPDLEFCDALEYGLPPTSGWGMGIDRVVALLSEVSHLRETIAFPVMRPQNLKKPQEDS